MLSLLNQAVAELLVIAVLLAVVFFVPAVIFLLFSVRRSLKRIADTIEPTAAGSIKRAAVELPTIPRVVISPVESIIPTAFGR